MFDCLPQELLVRIMEEISKRSDRENLAYSCKAVYKVMKPYLWQDLELKTGCPYHQNNILKNKHFIKDLTLRFHEKDTENLRDFLRKIFKKDSVNLLEIFLEGNVPHDIFSLLMSKSMQLRKLDFSVYGDFQWDLECLVFPSTLKRLELYDSGVTDSFLASIINANLKTLESMDIRLCNVLTPTGFLPISKLVNLKYLTLHEIEGSAELNVSFVSELKNLEYLNFENVDIVEDSHIGIWKCLSNLK